jgi:hypothetical protein
VFALLHNLPILHHTDQVRAADGAQPVAMTTAVRACSSFPSAS